jgi:Asp-tRNA(Asn)/Glu-tRNA(Gln) amidotransferase A subunit family amidase
MAARLRTVERHIASSGSSSVEVDTTRADEVILRLPVNDLAANIAAGKLTATEVLRVYKRRAAAVHAATNCVVWWVDDAEEVAAALDRHFAATGATVGALHGVPCSIKDHFAVRGTPVTMGVTALRRRGQVSKEDAAIVAALRDAGAVVFVKTTMTEKASGTSTHARMHSTSKAIMKRAALRPCHACTLELAVVVNYCTQARAADQQPQ